MLKSPLSHRTESSQQVMFSRGKKLVELQEIHQADVIAALSYLKRLSYINHSRIVMIGCSFGRIQTVLAIGKPPDALDSYPNGKVLVG